MTSPAPLWFQCGTEITLKRHFSPIDSILVFVGYQGNVCVCAASLSHNSILQLDTGVYGDYSSYVSHGIRAFSDLGFDGATSFAVYRNPIVSELGSVLGDLLSSPRPNALCTRKRVRGQGNVYVPDYVRILGELHDRHTIDP